MGNKKSSPRIAASLSVPLRLGNVGIVIPQPHSCSPLQNDIITLLATTLYKLVSTAINYDHATLTIPKAKIPLTYRRHRYDIACLIADRVILLDVLNIPATYWTNPQETDDGNSQNETL